MGIEYPQFASVFIDQSKFIVCSSTHSRDHMNKTSASDEYVTRTMSYFLLNSYVSVAANNNGVLGKNMNCEMIASECASLDLG